MALGADDYLTKPFEKSDLLSAVSGRLSRFQHLEPANGLPEFLADAQQTGSLASLSADRRPHAVPRRQLIYAEGDEATRLYFVQAGRVKISKTTAAGKELITGICAAGEFFGYRALLAGSPHHDAAMALDDSTLRYIPADDFTQLLLRNPEVSQQFVRMLANRADQQDTQLLDLAYGSLRKRVADSLLYLHAQQLLLSPTEPLIQLARENMAALIGTTPESLSRILSEFRQDESIELTPKFIKVLQPDKLRRSNW